MINNNLECYQHRGIKGNDNIEGLNSLEDALNKFKRIFLLGAAGLGKSTELIHLEDILKAKSQQVYKVDLKDFLNNHKIKKFIFGKKTKINNQILLLDGLDEMKDIYDFLSKLNVFLQKHTEIRFVISCRSNVYKEFSLSSQNIKAFYLEPLNKRQINTLIKNKLGTNLNYNQLDKYYGFLDTPFNINLFCNYYNSKKAFPTSQNDIWSFLIDNELELLNKSYFKNSQKLDKSHIEKCLQMLAITNELMLSNSTKDSDVYELLKNDKSIISKVSFIEFSSYDDSLSFRHKIYQEYFAACFLKNLDFDKILDLITIYKQPVLKRAFKNVLFFLLNILEKKKFDLLVEWLYLNDYKILLLCDSDRLNEKLKKNIFKKYFESEIITKKRGLYLEDTISFNQLLDFTDIAYLLDIINQDNDDQNITTAIYLLGLNEKKQYLKEIYEKFHVGALSDKFNENYLIAYIQRKFHLKDIRVFTTILEHYKESNNDETHHNLIAAISDLKLIDDTIFDYFLNSLKKLYFESLDNNKILTIRYTEHYISTLILKKLDVFQLIEVLKIIENHDYSLNLSSFYSNEFKEKLSAKISVFIQEDYTLIAEFIDLTLLGYKNISNTGDFYLRPMLELNKHDEVIDYILTQTINYDTTSILIKFLTEDKLPNLIERLLDLKLETNYFDLLVNLCFQKNQKLGYKLETLLNASKVKLESLPLKERIQQRTILEEENSKILFNLNLFEEKLDQLFTELKKDKINSNDFDIRNRQQLTNQSWIVFSAAFTRTLAIILKKDTELTKEQILEYFKDDYFVLNQISTLLLQKQQGKLSTFKEAFITEKALKLSKEILFDDIYTLDSQGYIIQSKQMIFNIKLLLKLDEIIDIDYGSSFYLNTLQYANSNLLGVNLGYLKEKVKNQELFNQQILNNLLSKKLDNHCLASHIKYALNNNLECDEIQKYIFTNYYIQSDKKILKKYCDTFLKDNPFWFLDKCYNNSSSSLHWNAIDLMLEYNIEETEILLSSIEHLNDIFSHVSKPDFIKNALSVLFYFNSPKTLEYYRKSLDYIDSCTKGNYRINHIERLVCLYDSDLDIIQDIFDFYYLDITEEHTPFIESNLLYRILLNFISNESYYNLISSLFKNMLTDITYNKNHYYIINYILEEIEKVYNHMLTNRDNAFNEIKNNINPQEKNTMIQETNYNINNSQNFQVGNNNSQSTHIVNNITNTTSTCKEIITLLKEFEQLKDDNEKWKEIFMQGMQELIDLDNSSADLTPARIEGNPKIKGLLDWLNIFADKTEKWTKIIDLPFTLQSKIGELQDLFTKISTWLPK